MIRELIRNEELLSTPCEPATAEDAELAEDLVDTLLSIDDAAGLAANQIGVAKAVIAFKDERENPQVMYNPKILLGLNGFKTEESCLTRDEVSKVTRYQKIKVQYQVLQEGTLRTRKRDYTGWTAQVIQHMVDHCKGKLV